MWTAVPRLAFERIALLSLVGLASGAGCSDGGAPPRATPIDAAASPSTPSAVDAAVMTPLDATAARPQLDAMVPTQRPAAVSPFGLSTSGEALADLNSMLPLVSAAGCSQLRAFPPWHALEANRGTLDFSTTDALLQAARKEGIEVSGLFAYSTLWALPAGEDDLKRFPLAHLDEWASYVGKLSARYASSVRYWEVWNEPNATGFNAGKDSPAGYATLVERAYRAAKSSGSNAQIGLTAANCDLRFLSQVISSLAALGAAGSFDFVALHPYELLLRLLESDGEVQFLSIVDNVRKMLAEHAPERATVPIRFSEIGARIGGRSEGVTIDEAIAADLLIKAYVLGLAQGVQQLQWFEIKDAGGSQSYGLWHDDATPRLTRHSFSLLTSTLGAYPRYLGWLALDDDKRAYGFVFERDGEPVLVTWMPRSGSSIVVAPGALSALSSDGTRAEVAEGSAIPLTERPKFVLNVPQAWVDEARRNVAQPFPWGTRSESPQLATLELGKPNIERGIDQDQPATTEFVRFGDGSQGARINPGASSVLDLALDPHFADYNTRDVYVRARIRSIEPDGGQPALLNLFYQPRSGVNSDAPAYPYKAVADGWYTVPDDRKWLTVTWRVTDAMFVHTFGYSLYLRLEGSHPIAVGKVEVSKVPF
jgi:hypothetical protein